MVSLPRRRGRDRSAHSRCGGTWTAPGPVASEVVEHVEYEQMLHDSLTGLPTLPVMIERSRNLFKERGELVVLYLNFVRYSKIEEITGGRSWTRCSRRRRQPFVNFSTTRH